MLKYSKLTKGIADLNSCDMHRTCMVLSFHKVWPESRKGQKKVKETNPKSIVLKSKDSEQKRHPLPCIVEYLGPRDCSLSV